MQYKQKTGHSCKKSQKQDYSGVGPLIYQGTTINDPIAKANVLVDLDYFSSVFIQKDVSYTPNMNSDTSPSISHQRYI